MPRAHRAAQPKKTVRENRHCDGCSHAGHKRRLRYSRPYKAIKNPRYQYWAC